MCILFTNENEENAKRDSNKNFLFWEARRKKFDEKKWRWKKNFAPFFRSFETWGVKALFQNYIYFFSQKKEKNYDKIIKLKNMFKFQKPTPTLCSKYFHIKPKLIT